MIPAMKELVKQHKHHRKNGGNERLGQFFYNTYCKAVTLPTGMSVAEDDTLAGIFAAKDKVAMGIIQQWLLNNSYCDTLPPMLRAVLAPEKSTV